MAQARTEMERENLRVRNISFIFTSTSYNCCYPSNGNGYFIIDWNYHSMNYHFFWSDLFFSIFLSTHKLVSNKSVSHPFFFCHFAPHTLQPISTLHRPRHLPRTHTKPPAQRRSFASVQSTATPMYCNLQTNTTENAYRTRTHTTRSRRGHMHWSLSFKKWHHWARIQLCFRAFFFRDVLYYGSVFGERSPASGRVVGRPFRGGAASPPLLGWSCFLPLLLARFLLSVVLPSFTSFWVGLFSPSLLFAGVFFALSSFFGGAVFLSSSRSSTNNKKSDPYVLGDFLRFFVFRF